MARHAAPAGGLMPARSFDDLRDIARAHGPVRIAIAGGEDPNVLLAVTCMIEDGFVSHAVLTGDAAAIRASAPSGTGRHLDAIDAHSPADCARAAVGAVRSGQADILMKGETDSTSYLRAVVDRDTGLRGSGVLSNVTVAHMPSLPRLIAATDNGILPAPTLEQKRAIILNTAPLFRGLGIDPVHVAAVCATEKASDALPATRDAQALAQEPLPGFVVGGPFGYDVAVSPQAARIKTLHDRPAAGVADLLLFPTIDAANAVAKSWKFHGQAETGSLVMGARVPVLLNSRSDGPGNRINGLLLAIAALTGA